MLPETLGNTLSTKLMLPRYASGYLLSESKLIKMKYFNVRLQACVFAGFLLGRSSGKWSHSLTLNWQVTGSGCFNPNADPNAYECQAQPDLIWYILIVLLEFYAAIENVF